MSDHTPMPKVSRLEVIATGARRRWTLEEKQRIVAESYGGPRQVSATARCHGLSASQLFAWRRLDRQRRLLRADETVTFARAVIASAPLASSPLSGADDSEAAEHERSSSSLVSARGRMDIVLRSGHRVVVDASVDIVALARVIAVLERP